MQIEMVEKIILKVFPNEQYIIYKPSKRLTFFVFKHIDVLLLVRQNFTMFTIEML